MVLGPEYTQVEKPLIDQLTGWAGCTGRVRRPRRLCRPILASSGRTSFSEVFLTTAPNQMPTFRINPDPAGSRGSTGDRLYAAVNALTGSVRRAC